MGDKFELENNIFISPFKIVGVVYYNIYNIIKQCISSINCLFFLFFFVQLGSVFNVHIQCKVL